MEIVISLIYFKIVKCLQCTRNNFAGCYRTIQDEYNMMAIIKQ